MRRSYSLAVLLVFGLAAVSAVQASSIGLPGSGASVPKGQNALSLSSCATDPGTGNIVCNLFEENVYPLTWTDVNNPGTPGYVVLMDSGNPGTGVPGNTTDQQNVALWSDVLEFDGNVNQGTGSTQLQLLYTSSAFPTYATVAANNGFFILENHGGVNQSGPTVWDPNGDGSWLFYVYSPEVPEPASLVLAGPSLIALAGLFWRRRRLS